MPSRRLQIVRKGKISLAYEILPSDTWNWKFNRVVISAAGNNLLLWTVKTETT